MYTLIVNPVSGKYNANTIHLFETSFQSVRTIMTEYQGHATELMTVLSDTVVCIMGGDGLIHEVVNGWMKNQDRSIRFAIIPAGSGNHVAKALGINNIEDGIRAIKEGEVVDMDIIKLKNKDSVVYSVNVIIGGLPMKINDRASQIQQNWGISSLKYDLATVAELPNVCNTSWKINNETVKLNCLFIHNTPSCGNGLKVAPKASVTDGKAEVVWMEDCGIMYLSFVLILLMFGAHESRTKLLEWDDSIEIEGGSVTIDGQSDIYETPAKLTLLKKALPIYSLPVAES
jgi:diacylglycerol kinase family enzyme